MFSECIKSFISARSLVLLATLAVIAPASYAQELSFLPDTGKKETESTSQPTIAIESSTKLDKRIHTRITDIYQQVKGLNRLNVKVDGGVVTLSGSVEDTQTKKRAASLVQRVEGVVAVENEIQLDRELATRWDIFSTRLENQFKSFITLLPSIIVALLIVTAGWFVARYVGHKNQLFSRITPNPFIGRLLTQLVQIAIFLGSVFVALMMLDATSIMGTLAGALGIAGLALGFATRDTVENYIASILLSIRQPFSVHDHVIIDGHEGKVVRLNSRSTILMSFDGNHIRIPNSVVYKSTIINYTLNPLRRFEFLVGVDTDLDLQQPRELALACLQEMDAIENDPSPLCLVDELGDSSVILRVLGWVDQRKADFGKARSEALRRVKETFDDANIVMPEPIVNINLREQGAKTAKVTNAPVQQKPLTESDVKPDRSIEKQIETTEEPGAKEDLLSPVAPKE